MSQIAFSITCVASFDYISNLLPVDIHEGRVAETACAATCEAALSQLLIE